jgi:hypothetical protein
VKFGRAGSTPGEAARALDGARLLLAWGRVRIAAQAAAEKAAEKAAGAKAAPGAAPAAPGSAPRTGGGR